MGRRKRIGLITISPERDYQRRIIKGILKQCQKYDYDVFMFSSMVQHSLFFKDYLQGELNIYNLINFDLLDAVIITPVPMTDDHDYTLVNSILKKVQTECKKPVISIDLGFGDYETVYTDDFSAFYSIAHHLITVHDCKDFAVLTGMKDYYGSITRLNGVKAALEACNLPFDENKVYYGDFWFDSGEKLAERYISGELELPDAVVCASDHMAIGLVNRLIENGIKVPQDVIVTGYGAERDASLNNPPITSFYPEYQQTGELAVKRIHSILTGNKSENEKIDFKKNLCFGATCGCKEDVNYTRERFKTSEMNFNHDFHDETVWKGVDMGILNESYLFERLTASHTTSECFKNIYESKYLLRPFESLFLCMNQNWIDSDSDLKEGFTEKMHLLIYADNLNDKHGIENHSFLDKENEVLFDTKDMLPPEQYIPPCDEAVLTSFVSVHFNDIPLGYAVVRNKCSENFVPGAVCRNYMRYVNNSIEMIRARNRIVYLSEHDTMTGLYNRLGMENAFRELAGGIEKSQKMLAIVIDMDGLKLMNDTYGHAAGDAGIKKIAASVQKISEKHEICVRGGGDEFYLLGIGDYTDEKVKARIEKFNKLLEASESEDDIKVGASSGYCILPFTEETDFNEALDRADIQMYLQKRSKKDRR
ncbi:MAG: GGDEF domain-containing protein [Treponema sp.]|nr:GGDEF domain-containing protein [Treponema sp.]